VRALDLGEVLPYNKTVSDFDYYGSDKGLTANTKRRYNLFYQLKANEIYLSKAEINDSGYAVVGKMHDIYTGQETEVHRWELTSADGSLKDQMTERRFFSEYFHFIPNTTYLNLGSYKPSININNNSYNGSSARGDTLLGKVADGISYFELAHLERPRTDVKEHLTFDFIPELNFFVQKISINDYAPIRGADFDRIYFSGGYGMEVGNLSRIGFFYFDLIPAPTWTQIHYTTSTQDGRLSRFSVSVVEELGYSRFIGDHFVAKIFVRGISEDGDLWSAAIHKVSGQEESVDTVSSTLAGVALGYYIPSSLNQKNSWKAVERH
jgi:hypothetical protein